MKKTIFTDQAPVAIGPYSQAVQSGNLLFLSGQIPINPISNAVEAEGIEEQTEQVMKNISAILQKAGVDFQSVIKTTCFLDNMNDFTVFNQVYEKYFISKPARSCIAVKTLPKNVLCEVEVIAEIES